MNFQDDQFYWVLNSSGQEISLEVAQKTLILIAPLRIGSISTISSFYPMKLATMSESTDGEPDSLTTNK